MDAEKVYQIVESVAKGKIAVAVRDIQAGELVLLEKEPLLHFSHDYNIQYKQNCGYELSEVFAAYNTFMKKLPSEKQHKFLSLYGPTSGVTADNFRAVGRDNFLFRFNHNEEPRRLTQEEVEVFVKVAQIFRLNSFEEQGIGFEVFEEITRFSHSCASNCEYTLEGTTAACHAKRFIHAGEEMTLVYVNRRDLDPTHERRYKYLETKDFTCHCPRCDAMGDDTRQFDCSDLTCKGVMMVCQPINQKPIPITNASYTGVEYVEPHLLPCTVCHRAASADYQTEMLDFESQLPGMAMNFQAKYDAVSSASIDRANAVLSDILRLKLPRRHAAALPLLKLEWQMKCTLFLHCNTVIAPVAQEALLQYFAALENILPGPHRSVVTELCYVVSMCFLHNMSPIFTHQQEKHLCQKALRMHLILFGRGCRDQALDTATLRALQKHSPVVSTEVCAFCEESPLRAALTLRSCGKCMQVVYCSAGCQKAHWKLHRITCAGCAGK